MGLLKILRKEGAGTLFRGMSALAYTSVPRFALIFYANSWGRLLAMNPPEKEVKLKHILLGGVFSQLVVAPTVTAPLERVKVLLQVFPTKFSGQRDCLSYILRTEGWQGVFRGSLLTVARDIPAFCSYFATYETLRSLVKTEEDEVGIVMTAIIGAISGVVGWAVELPADNLKNTYQSSLAGTVRDILAQGGVRQLYRGLGVCLLRAVPANAATFLAYEYTVRGLVNLDILLDKDGRDGSHHHSHR